MDFLHSPCTCFILCVLALQISAESPRRASTLPPNRVIHEQRLRSKLFDHYDRKVRPGGSVSDIVVVYTSLMLLHIEGIDAERQVLKVHTWAGMKWNDPRLNWDSPRYGNITEMHTSDEDIWIPDLALYNNAEGKTAHSFGEAPVIIQSNGDIWHIPPASFSVQCNMTFEDWPYDMHTCSLIIGSWTQHGWNLDLQLADKAVGVDRSNYVENDQWKLVNVSAYRILQNYAGMVEPYVSLSFHMTVQRNPSNYAYALVYPANAILIASCLLFLLPDFRFRLIVGMLQILTLAGESVFLWTILPPTYGSPSIVYLVALSIGCIMSAVFISWFLDLISRFDRPVPNWLKTRLIPLFGPALCVTASRFWTPQKVTLNRGPEACDDRDVLTVNYDTEENGYPLQSKENGLDQGQPIMEDRSWVELSSILSRLILVPYTLSVVIIIMMH